MGMEYNGNIIGISGNMGFLGMASKFSYHNHDMGSVTTCWFSWQAFSFVHNYFNWTIDQNKVGKSCKYQETNESASQATDF